MTEYGMAEGVGELEERIRALERRVAELERTLQLLVIVKRRAEDDRK